MELLQETTQDPSTTRTHLMAPPPMVAITAQCRGRDKTSWLRRPGSWGSTMLVTSESAAAAAAAATTATTAIPAMGWPP